MSMMDRFTKAEFTSNGSWTAPAGVTRILIWGMGGGQGGCGGGTGVFFSPNLLSFGGRGGIGVSLQPYVVTVVPNMTYSITIGAGGTGGAGAAVGAGLFGGAGGGAGGNTIFGNSIIEWKGAVGPTTNSPQIIPGFSFYNASVFNTSGYASRYEYLAAGGTQGNANVNSSYMGYPGRFGQSAAPGTSGGTAAFAPGGGGGSGMSAEGLGGVGGNGVANATGGNGGNAPANSGAGGGGGAGGSGGSGGLPASSRAGGNGGNGGSGKMIIMWVE